MTDVLGRGDPRENVTQTVTLLKLPGMKGLVMVWVEMSLDGRTDLYVFARRGVTEARHCGDILEPVVGSYAGTIGDVFILMQDNARANTVLLYTTFLDDKGIRVMNWLATFPYLNPIEHTWDILSRRIRQRLHCPENVQNLIEALVQKLQMIPQKGIRSMPLRCHQDCVDDRGGHTRYW